MMQLAITGGLGFIGSHFYQQLYKTTADCSGLILDNDTYAARKDLSLLYQKVDISDMQALRLAIGYPSHIINFAAESHVDNSIENDLPFIQTNIVGTVNLLKLASEFHCRFHQISTDEVYGSVDKPSTKFTPYNPKNPYAASKASADHFVDSYRNTYKTRATISRCGNNFGPGQHSEKFIPTVIRNMIQKKPIPVYGTGENMREWLYVEDHVNMLLHYLRTGLMKDVNIGPGKLMSNLEMIDRLHYALTQKDISHTKDIEFVEDRLGHDQQYSLSPDLMFQGFNLTHWDTAMHRTIDYYVKKERG